MPAVGLNGVDTANPRMGDVVAVYGAGLVGLGVIAACSHRGCVVVAVDLEQNRLEVARKLGADYLINGTTQNVVEELQKIVPEGADVVFESTGVPACIDRRLNCVGGTVSLCFRDITAQPRSPINLHRPTANG